MKTFQKFCSGPTGLALVFAVTTFASNAWCWPGSPLEGRQKSCATCHAVRDRWVDENKIIIDIVDPVTRKSFRQNDGSFLIEVKRNTERRVLSVFGAKPTEKYPPDMVGWLYVDPNELADAPESSLKFASGWRVNRPFCGKRLNERVDGYEGDHLASITMTIMPTAPAVDGEVKLQVVFKSLARGLRGNYYEKNVKLKVID